MADADGRTCHLCTFVNKTDALCCSMCSTVLKLDGTPCYRCTLFNPADADVCGACGLLFEKKEVAWVCSVCGGGTAFVFLECAHKACIGCHAKWIACCDNTGKEPTCMACDEEHTDSKVLSPAAIRLMLGDDASEQRDQRQFAKVANLVDCPTPDCKSRFELSDDVSQRWTHCHLCRQQVELKRPNLASVLAAPAGVGGASATGANSSGGGTSSGAMADDAITLSSDDDIGEEHQTLQEREAAQRAEQLGLLKELGLKQCPDCRIAIEKERKTCHKFQCICGCRFCWKCGKRANERGIYTCTCTGADHVAWDNVRNHPASRTTRPGKGTKRPRDGG